MKIIYFISVHVFTAVVIQIVIFRLWRRVVWCLYVSVSVRNSLQASGWQWGQSQCNQIIQSGSQRTVTFQYSCANSISRLCATLYIVVGGKVVTQTNRPHFDPADGGSKFLRDVGTPVQHYTVAQNPDSAQLTVPVSVAACREYVNELPPRAIPLIVGGNETEPGGYPHMVSGQATRCYWTTFRSRSQANVLFIWNVNDKYL